MATRRKLNPSWWKTDRGKALARKREDRAFSKRNLEIYELYRQGEPVITLASKFYVSHQRISQIIRRIEMGRKAR